MVRQSDWYIVGYLLNDILPQGAMVAMLKVYLDHGAKKEAYGVMSVGAALFRSFCYDQFLHVWEPFLKAWNAKAFQATDFYPGAEDFKRKTKERKQLFEQDSRRLPELIA